MNSDGKLYRGSEEIEAAHQRGETLYAVPEHLAEHLVGLNRADRRDLLRREGGFKRLRPKG